MWHELWIALALLLILEGVFPFLSPDRLRQMLLSIQQMTDAQLRFAGLTSMLVGVVLLYLINT